MTKWAYYYGDVREVEVRDDGSIWAGSSGTSDPWPKDQLYDSESAAIVATLIGFEKERDELQIVIRWMKEQIAAIKGSSLFCVVEEIDRLKKRLPDCES